MSDIQPTSKNADSKQAFVDFQKLVEDGESSRALENLAKHLSEQKHFHELFEVRKMLLRERMGLPIRSSESTADLPAEHRAGYEQGLINACEEVGELLVNENRVREAWVYLQAVDDQCKVRKMIMSLELDDENADDLIGLAVNEGVAPVEGFQMILDRMGSCNAITTYDSFFPVFPLDVRRTAAGKLLVHLHRELKSNLVSHIQSQQANADVSASIAKLVEEFPWVFNDRARHIDESHLASAVRIGRVAEDHETLGVAVDLAVYGQAMAADYSAVGDAPFEDLYVDSELYYRALLGENVESAKSFFKAKADSCVIEDETAVAVEWYLYLLKQLNQNSLAIDETLRLLPGGASQLNISPNLYELCRTASDWSTVREFFLREGRLLDFSLALLQSKAV